MASGALSSLDLLLKQLAFSILRLCYIRAGVYKLPPLLIREDAHNGWKTTWSAAASRSCFCPLWKMLLPALSKGFCPFQKLVTCMPVLMPT